MALSVRLDPALEARVDEESRRRGVSKSEVVKDALERVLGLKDPYALLLQVRNGTRSKSPRALLDQVYSGTPMHQTDLSVSTGKRFKAKLRAKRSA